MLDKITDLPQFERELQNWSNAKNYVLKEQERILSALKAMKKSKETNEKLSHRLNSETCKPTRFMV